MLGFLLALTASASWGVSDFLGGLQTRRFSALSVLIVSQPIGLVLAYAIALTFGDEMPSASKLALGAFGGVAVVLALGAFYRAMALGTISVVATIGALGIVVPVIGGIVQGEAPEGLQAVGAVVAIGAIVLVAREPDPEWRQANRASVGLAALAALGFGTFFLALDGAAAADPAWAIAAARTGGVTLLLVAALWLRPTIPRARGAVLAALLAIGFFDILANSLYAVATTHGILPVVAVGASLYSAVTVLLARFVLGERLAPSQRLGIVVALTGLTLIAAGS